MQLPTNPKKRQGNAPNSPTTTNQAKQMQLPNEPKIQQENKQTVKPIYPQSNRLPDKFTYMATNTL